MQRLYLVALLMLLVGCSAPLTSPSSSAEQANPPVVLTTAETVEATTAAPTEAIAPAEEPATAESTGDTDAAQNAVPVLVPTATPQAADTTQTDWLATVTVEGDFYILGNPNAPIRLVDYSDFL